MQENASSKPYLNPDREQALIERMRGGDRSAEQALVLAHQSLARGYAKRYGRRFGGMRFDDLFHEGVLGLLEAAQRFDPDRGVRFATYARWWVRHYVNVFVQRNARAVACPNTRAMRCFAPRHGALKREVEQRIGREATVAELAAHAGAKQHDLAMVDAYLSSRDCSYDALPIEPPTTHAATAEDHCVSSEHRAALRRAVDICIEEMGDRAYTILRGRYLGDDSQTFRELGEQLGLSRERVRQLEQRCLQRIGQVMRRPGAYRSSDRSESGAFARAQAR